VAAPKAPLTVLVLVPLQVMVEQLHPEGVPVEVSLEADKPQIAFRHLRKVCACVQGVGSSTEWG
jgi:hypothetical protein